MRPSSDPLSPYKKFPFADADELLEIHARGNTYLLHMRVRLQKMDTRLLHDQRQGIITQGVYDSLANDFYELTHATVFLNADEMEKADKRLHRKCEYNFAVASRYTWISGLVWAFIAAAVMAILVLSGIGVPSGIWLGGIAFGFLVGALLGYKIREHSANKTITKITECAENYLEQAEKLIPSRFSRALRVFGLYRSAPIENKHTGNVENVILSPRGAGDVREVTEGREKRNSAPY